MPAASVLGNSALLTIDVQADFYAPGAPCLIDGTAELIPVMGRVARTYRTAGLPIIHAVRLYLPDGSNAEPVRRGLVRTRSVVRPGTQGSQPAPELLPEGAERLDPDVLLAGGMQQVGHNEWLMYKPRWGAFYRTGLEQHLCSLEIDTIAFVGCNFPNCPRMSLYEASERDLGTVVVSDALSGLYERGLRELEGIGTAVMTANEVEHDLTE